MNNLLLEDCLTPLQLAIMIELNKEYNEGLCTTEIRRRLYETFKCKPSLTNVSNFPSSVLVLLTRLGCVNYSRIKGFKNNYRIKEPIGSYMLLRSLELYKKLVENT